MAEKSTRYQLATYNLDSALLMCLKMEAAEKKTTAAEILNQMLWDRYCTPRTAMPENSGKRQVQHGMD